MLKFLQRFLPVLIGALCLLTDALYNGYPIVYSDTSTYIISGFETQTPFDRPITYGIFLRLASFGGWSFWPVIGLQALLLSGLLFAVFRLVLPESRYRPVALISIFLLSLFTGLSWITSQLLADVFTPIAVLCLVLLLFGKQNRRSRIGLYVLFFIAVATHISHVLLFCVLVALVFLLRRLLLPAALFPQRNLRSGILLLLSLGAILTMGSAMSKSKHVFFMGAMVEHGITKAYLDEHCGERDFMLCRYKDSLPARAYEFVWDGNSPLYKIGGWSASKKEFNTIIKGTFSEPKFIGLHLKASCLATAEQLVRFETGDGNGVFSDTTRLYQRVLRYCPNDIHRFAASRQNQSRLSALPLLNRAYYLAVLLSLVTIAFMMVVYFRKLSRIVLSLTGILLLAVLVNAWDCGTFANAIDRLGCKMMWLIPLAAILLLCALKFPNVTAVISSDDNAGKSPAPSPSQD